MKGELQQDEATKLKLIESAASTPIELSRNLTMSIIVPAFNEAEGLPLVLRRLISTIDQKVEFIVVDDGSSDATRDVASSFPCRVLAHRTNQGKGAAIRTGLKAARAEHLVIIDADDTYPAEVVPQIAKLLDQYDIVVGSRNVDSSNIPLLNRVGNLCFRLVLEYLYGFKGSDPLSGLYGVRRNCLERMNLSASGFGVETEIAVKAARMGLKIVEVPISYGRRVGETKLRAFRDGGVILGTIARLIVLYNPLVVFILPGFFLGALGLITIALRLAGLSVASLAPAPHFFILAAMCVLTGYQLVCFGIFVRLYASLHRFVAYDRLVSLMKIQGVKTLGISFGFLLLFVGFGLGLGRLVPWLPEAQGLPTQTEVVILSSLLVVLGIQVIFSLIFLSVFHWDTQRDDKDALEMMPH